MRNADRAVLLLPPGKGNEGQCRQHFALPKRREMNKFFFLQWQSQHKDEGRESKIRTRGEGQERHIYAGGEYNVDI
jgi:hypothetical protein